VPDVRELGLAPCTHVPDQSSAIDGARDEFVRALRVESYTARHQRKAREVEGGGGRVGAGGGLGAGSCIASHCADDEAVQYLHQSPCPESRVLGLSHNITSAV